MMTGAGQVGGVSSYKALHSSSPLGMLTLASALLWLAALFGRDPPTLDAVPSRCVNGTSVTRSDWQPLGSGAQEGAGDVAIRNQPEWNKWSSRGK